MEKLSAQAQAVLLDMISPAPKGKYFARHGSAPQNGRVFLVSLRGKSVLFCRNKERLMSPEILDQVPHLVPQTLWFKPGWYAGWHYVVGKTTPEASRENGRGDPCAGSEE